MKTEMKKTRTHSQRVQLLDARTYLSPSYLRTHPCLKLTLGWCRMTFTNFDWHTTVQWLCGITDLPIAIKGVQTWEDTLLCMHYGVHPWLSNHGARQLDGSPAAVDTLIEIRRHCPEVLTRCNVIVDGGITRGTDVVKALCLGATAVGLGRSFLFSLTFGEKGVAKAIRILRHEMEVCLALLGVDSLKELGPQFVSVLSWTCEILLLIPLIHRTGRYLSFGASQSPSVNILTNDKPLYLNLEPVHL